MSIDWKPADLAELERKKPYLVSDGQKVAVAYLSKGVSLWYFANNHRGCYWKITHVAEINLPSRSEPK